MDKSMLAKEICNLSLVFGQFRLQSGETAAEYFDKYLFEANPIVLKRVAAYMEPLIPPGIEVLAGLEMGGIPIATALSLQSNIPAAFVRREARNYGTGKLAEGTDIRGKRVSIIEDVVTIGEHVIQSANELRNEGAVVEEVICVIEREPKAREKLAAAGLHLHSLYTMDDLLGARIAVED